MMRRNDARGACAGLSLSLFAGAAMAVDPPTPFETDVNTAINRGLDYLAATGAYASYASGWQRLISTTPITWCVDFRCLRCSRSGRAAT